MKEVLERLQIDSVSICVLLLFWGVLASTVYIAFSKVDEKRKTIAVLAAATVCGVVLLAISTSPTKMYNYFAYRHNSSGCLVEANDKFADNEDLEYGNIVCFFHYFENKKLEIDSSIEEIDRLKKQLSSYMPTIEIIDTSKRYNIDSELINEVVSNTQHIEIKKTPWTYLIDESYYLIDKTWLAEDTIACIQVDEQIYFLSKQLAEDILINNYDQDLLSNQELSVEGIFYMNKLRKENLFNQVWILLALFLVGIGICLISFNGKNNALSFFMAFPVGVATVSVIFMISILLGIPFSVASIVIIFILILAAIIGYICVKKIACDKLMIVKQILLFSVTAVTLVYGKIYNMSKDSFDKTIYGVKLAELNLSKVEIISRFMNNGMMEPIINGIGWKCHVDFMYAMYSLMPICIIGLFVYGGVRCIKKGDILKGIIVLFTILSLVTNFDYMLNGIWILSNGTIASLILILIINIMFQVNQNEKNNLIIFVLTFCIVMTRVEGTCYICLIAALLCGLKHNSKACRNISVLMGGVGLFWQAMLQLFCNENSIFWNKKESAILCIGSVFIIVLPLLMGLKLKVIFYLKKYYYKIAMLIFFVGCMFMYCDGPDLSHHTALILVKHLFGFSYLSNSGAFWGFFVLMLPLIIYRNKKQDGFIISVVFCYLMLTYLIFSLRKGDPIHVGIGDSCRRVIQQIMPLAMFSLIYNKDVWAIERGKSTNAELLSRVVNKECLR